jgi:hypothetical protein
MSRGHGWNGVVPHPPDNTAAHTQHRTRETLTRTSYGIS